MLGNMPSTIPNLPVFAGSSGGSDSTMSTDNSTSITTSSTLSAAMASENAAQSQLAWLLPALSYAASNVQKPSDRILVAPGFPTLPKQLLDKIHRWEYVDLVDLLPSTSSHDASIPEPSSPRFLLFPGCEFVRHKKRQIANIADWIQAFTVYVAAMSTKYPEATLDLLAYQLTIIKASQQYDGLYWRAYDTHYRVNAAASGNRKWAKLDTDLYTRFFTGRARELQVCNICDSSSHTAVSCPLKLRKQPLSEAGKPNTSSTWGDKRRKVWPADICAEFNAKGMCFFKDKCKYRHSCGICGGRHPAKSCSHGTTQAGASLGGNPS